MCKKLINLLCVASLATLMQPFVCEAQVVNPNHDFTMKATLADVSNVCELTYEEGTDTFLLGTLNPSQLQPTPTLSSGDQLLEYIYTYSAFGSLKAPYQSKSPGTQLVISCIKSSVGTDFSRVSLKFGGSVFKVNGSIGVSTQNFAFKLLDSDLANQLAILLYVDDVYATSAGQNGLVKVDESFPLVQGQSFRTDPSDQDKYIARFNITPGLFRINALTDVSDPTFRVEIPVSVTYN